MYEMTVQSRRKEKPAGVSKLNCPKRKRIGAVFSLKNINIKIYPILYQKKMQNGNRIRGGKRGERVLNCRKKGKANFL